MSMETKEKKDQKTQVKARETKVIAEVSVTTAEISKSWQEFEPEIPLTYLLASRTAARTKNS